MYLVLKPASSHKIVFGNRQRVILSYFPQGRERGREKERETIDGRWRPAETQINAWGTLCLWAGLKGSTGSGTGAVCCLLLV